MAASPPGYGRRVLGDRPLRLPLALLAAILAAWLVALPAATLATLVMAGVTEVTAQGVAEVLDIWLAAWVLLPVAGMLAVLGAVPVHLLLAAIRRQGVAAYALAGALAGLVVLRFGGGHPVAMAAAVASGAAAGLAFRAVWRPARAAAAPSAGAGPPVP